MGRLLLPDATIVKRRRLQQRRYGSVRRLRSSRRNMGRRKLRYAQYDKLRQRVGRFYGELGTIAQKNIWFILISFFVLKKDKNNFCYFNGEIRPFQKAGISLDDLGILRGYGVFDVMKTVNGKIFLFDVHIKRLKDSADYLGARLPMGKIKIKETIKKLISKNKIKQASIRIVLTGGRSVDAMHFDFKAPTFYILVSEFKPLSGELYESGIKLATVEHSRDAAEIKTTNYVEAVRVINKRQKKEKFFEILYISDGAILEAATSNFFVFIGDKLVTPKDNILKGITRNLVLKLAKKKFEVEERKLKTEELNLATESFIAATNKNIVPVVQVDDKKIGNGKPGKNTKKLMELFKEFMKNY